MLLVPDAGVAARDRAGRFLMVHRGDDATWALPAGRLEPGESWLECATREFREETSLSVVITGLLGIYSDPAASLHVYPDGQVVQFVGVVFEGEVEGSPRTLRGDEITAVEYFAPDELLEPLFAPSRVVLDDALSDHPRPVLR